MAYDPTNTDHRLPDGWTTTKVKIEETVTYDVIVSHPAGASEVDIAASALEEFGQSDDREKDYSHDVYDGELRIDGKEIEIEPGWDRDLPEWHSRRPEIAAYLEPAQ